MLRLYTNYLKALLGSKKGQGMVEYGLIIGLIAIVVIVALTTMGSNITGLFNSVSGRIPTVVPTTSQ